jgi:hypothetical protein
MRTILIKDGNRCQLSTFFSAPYPWPVLIVVNRFRAEDDEEGLRRGLEGAWGLLAAKSGYLGGEIGRNLDDPTLWLLTTRWENVGSYRRALSAYDVKLNAVPTLSRALDEPSAYESAAPGETLNEPDARRFG